MVAEPASALGRLRRHLQRSACCRQPVDRRTTRPDRGGIARTNPHADERPFRQRVTRFGHVPAYRASRPLSQCCRGSASGEATARSRIHRRNRMRPPKSKPPARPNQMSEIASAQHRAATTGHAKLHRCARQAAQSGFHPDCNRSSGRRPQYPNQRVEVNPVFFRLSDSCRTPRAPGRTFSKLPAKSGLRTGPGRTPLRSLRSRACSRGSDKRVPVAETWVKPNGEARPQRTSPYRPYDYQHIRLSEAKSLRRGKREAGSTRNARQVVMGMIWRM